MKGLAEGKIQFSPVDGFKDIVPGNAVLVREKTRCHGCEGRSANRCRHIASFKRLPIFGQCINVWSAYLFASHKPIIFPGLIVTKYKNNVGFIGVSMS